MSPLRVPVRALLGMLFALSCAGPASAEVRAEWSGVTGPSPETRIHEYELQIPRDGMRCAIDTIAVLEKGMGSLRVSDPDGTNIYQHNWGTRLSTARAALPVNFGGTYKVVVDLQGAVGQWRARVVSLPADSELRQVWLSCIGLLVLPFVLLAAGIRLVRARWYWYALGAVLAAFAAVGWLLAGVAFHLTVRTTLEESLAHICFLWVETGLLGVVSGLSWAVVAFAAAVMVPSFIVRRNHALAAGIGAGSAEMFVTGVFSLLGASALFGGGAKSKGALVELGYDMAVTPFAFAVEPIRYVLIATVTALGLAVMVHGFAARRVGDVVLGAGVVGAIRMSGSLMRMLEIEGYASRFWLIAFASLFALLAGLAYVRRAAQWPQRQTETELPMETYLREYREGRR